MSNIWTPTSWSDYPCSQEAVYENKALLADVLNQLAQKPPLIAIKPILELKQQLNAAHLNQAFILQAGDCAESFQDCRPAIIREQVNLMHRMMKMLQTAINKPIIPIGRIAGQYAKPRSFEYETQGERTLPSYRGDLINASPFNARARTPNPSLLLKGYASAEYTLKLIHAMQKKQAFYTSHEALHLPYEAALTRQCHQGLWYDLSTHLPWLGIRTNQQHGAHIEFLRGINNPIGIKIGPNTSPDALTQLIRKLNPNQATDRILLITRLGAQQVAHILPELIQSIQTHQLPVTWSCDPMHGNTEHTKTGIKTRQFKHIWHELEQTIRIHQTNQSHLGGIHLEVTPSPVTECLGGLNGPTEADLNKSYTSLLDPRLNKSQALELIKKLSSTSGLDQITNKEIDLNPR
ncbi:MAG: 3-deoxy-7-phosphoheptulonate synthase [Gammaproteobacteria bacterium]|nr:3-deoxy-7-phosphoheptulonate synthase [Gammaproteobacteria bacterium]MCH9715659.1 3-deoxy-7-phosphoheptulonate synthase [Gammaproteobacteria bacterium]MCH9763726.1 3-deoxy-7-phosphoheptulonate synthase [Gammaproteobacteria bacterium]